MFRRYGCKFLQAPELGNPVRVRSSNRCCMRRSFLFAVRTGHWETEKVEQKTQENKFFPKCASQNVDNAWKVFLRCVYTRKSKDCGKIRPPKVFYLRRLLFLQKRRRRYEKQFLKGVIVFPRCDNDSGNVPGNGNGRRRNRRIRLSFCKP